MYLRYHTRSARIKLFDEPSFIRDQRKLNSLFSFTALGASPNGCWRGPAAPSMLTMCGKAYRRIFDAENMYTGARYIRAAEAAWRLLGFHVMDRYPSVSPLRLHLPNEQNTSLSTSLFPVKSRTRQSVSFSLEVRPLRTKDIHFCSSCGTTTWDFLWAAL